MMTKDVSKSVYSTQREGKVIDRCIQRYPYQEFTRFP
jgi:hypothetical protein